MSLLNPSADPSIKAAERETRCAERSSTAKLYMELTKARLSALVVLTTAVGFVVAIPVGINWLLLLYTVIGTSLAAGSAAAINQVLEVARDARMQRTCRRPLPSGGITIRHALTAGIVMGIAGTAMLALLVNLASASLALLTIVLYVFIYTPMKARSSYNTLVGAVCGAIPPMIGWVAATGALDAGAWVLGAILFFWQIPHFFALAWLYREDYERGGFVMLPMLDARGELTASVIILTSLILLPLGMLATMIGLAGWVFLVGSLVLGLWMTALAVRFYVQRTNPHARGVFFASLLYLSLLLCLFMVDRGPVKNGSSWQASAVAAVPTETDRTAP
ncbi:MAG TPA: heme o synthase [Phycisphaerales bacterium]|nr:heme o synthase [Phycisphaerales bacterium]HRQ76605.1 heme o synthase [Phycisphaerales bacterium]